VELSITRFPPDPLPEKVMFEVELPLIAPPPLTILALAKVSDFELRFKMPAFKTN